MYNPTIAQTMSQLANIATRLRSSRLASDSFWALVGSAAGRGLSFIAGVAIARMLGSELYGEYGTIKNTLMMIAIFSSLGMGYSATKFIAESGDDVHRVAATHRIATRLTLLMSGLIAAVVILCAEHIALWIEAPHLDTTLRLCSIAVILNAINTTQTGELAGLGAYRPLAINNGIAGVFTLIASVALALCYGFDGAIAALILSLAFNALLNRRTIARHIERGAGKRYNSDYTKEVVRFSIPIAMQESLYSITHWASIFILIKLSGYAEYGVSAAANQWYAVLLFIPGALRNVALSHLAKSNKDTETNRTVLKRLMLINLLSTILPALCIGALSEWVVSWYGASFEGLRAVLCVVLISAVVNSVTNVMTQEFMAHNRNWFLFLSGLTRDVGATATLYFAIQSYGHGALTAAWVTLGFSVLYFVMLTIVYRHIFLNKPNSQ